jgi:hypothetical protein
MFALSAFGGKLPRPKQLIGQRATGRVLGALTGCLGIVLVSLLIAVPAAQASTCDIEYTGPANGKWGTEGNWSTGKAPTKLQVACIPAGKGTIEIAAGTTAEVKILTAKSALDIPATATLAIAEKVALEEPKVNEENASTFAGLTVGGTITTAGAWILMAGPVDLGGEIKSTPPQAEREEDVARLLSGTLAGDGTFNIRFQDIGGTIEPGGAGQLGTLHMNLISGMNSGAALVIDIKSATEFDHIAMGSNIAWDGTLDVNLLGGYEPPVGTPFLFETGGGALTEFETVTPGFAQFMEPNSYEVVVSPHPPAVVTEAATDVTETSAVIHGSVNPRLEQVSRCMFSFSIGFSSSLSCPTAPGKGGIPVSETVNLSNLTPGTTYGYELEAGNQETPNAKGGLITFKTLAAHKEETKAKEEPTGGEEHPASKQGQQPPIVLTNSPLSSSAVLGSNVSAAAVEELRLGCSKSQLVLNDAYIHGSRVVLIGSAAKSLAGKKVKIIFGTAAKQVATATVGSSGEYSTTAPVPPAKIREALKTYYAAEIGSVRSLHLKLTRRLLLEPPKGSGTTVTLSGRVALPLTRPITPIVVEQQLECGKTAVVQTFSPPASGVFHVTVTVPAGTKAGIYTLKSKVAANAHSTTHGFTTYSLPLPVAFRQ